MNERKKNPFEAELRALIEDFGWSEENARAFLNDKIGARRVQVDARLLSTILEQLSKVGIPFGLITVDFLVPEKRWREFEEVAQISIASKGGFVLNKEEASSLPAKISKAIN